MTPREELHALIDALPDTHLAAAEQILLSIVDPRSLRAGEGNGAALRAFLQDNQPDPQFREDVRGNTDPEH